MMLSCDPSMLLPEYILSMAQVGFHAYEAYSMPNSYAAY